MRSYIVGAVLGVTLLSPNVATRQVTFMGKVTDAATGQPIGGVQVVVQRTNGSALTDSTGAYRVVVPLPARQREATLIARRIGYGSVTQLVDVTGDRVRVDFALSSAAAMLSAQVIDARSAARAKRVAPPPAPVPLTAPMLHGLPTSPGHAAADASLAASGAPPAVGEFNTESYARVDESPFLDARANPRSTFSIDVDRASYSNVRRFVLTDGALPPKDAVRIEELLNYFPYENAPPVGEHPLSVTTEVAPAPWARGHRLVRVALQGRVVDAAKLPPSNLVFLIDVSGSMQSPDKLPLVKASLRLLVGELRPQDRVAIVVYAGAAGLVLPSTPGHRKDRILDAIAALEAGGSTAGGAGIRLAYDVARANYLRGGNNRVILATDGDFNVGASSDAEMVRLIEEKREQGTYLTVLGFGTGNLKDSKMEQLADKGNGNYAYVDDLLEARKVLVHEIGGTLLTIAKDVKLQVEFNPHRVAAYRLLGYENRALRDEDFANDAKDAGELGAGHAVTALYEIIPAGAPDARRVRTPDTLRYQRVAEREGAERSPELMFVKLRYKRPNEHASRLLEHPVVDRGDAVRPSDDFTFAAAVAAFGLILRDSEHKGSATMEDVVAMASRAQGPDRGGYRGEFVRLARAAERLLLAREGVVAER